MKQSEVRCLPEVKMVFPEFKKRSLIMLLQFLYTGEVGNYPSQWWSLSIFPSHQYFNFQIWYQRVSCWSSFKNCARSWNLIRRCAKSNPKMIRHLQPLLHCHQHRRPNRTHRTPKGSIIVQSANRPLTKRPNWSFIASNVQVGLQPLQTRWK